MDVPRGIRAVLATTDGEPIDPTDAAVAAKAITAPGDLDLDRATRRGYAGDVRAAGTAIRDASGLDVDLPETVTVKNRHHWIDATAEAVGRAHSSIAERDRRVSGLERRVSTASLAATLAYAARRVLGQYDPVLLGGVEAEHELSFVHPNVVAGAERLGVDAARFRRWIAFHEVAHAAEFATAPWLEDLLETRLRDAIAAAMASGDPRESMGDLARVMTVLEGYASLLMDHAFDDAAADLRRAVEARRRGGGPTAWLARRVFGITTKTAQYERGRAFFDRVAGARGLEGAGIVFADPANLPTEAELDRPRRWLDRVSEPTA